MPIALVAALAWLTVSNHCALAAIEEPASMASMRSCHDTEASHAPAKHQSGDDVECCKVLRATLTTPKSLAAWNASAFALQPYFVRPVLFLEPVTSKLTLELDTGPPFRGSFAETVLQRSILAHAPPSLA